MRSNTAPAVELTIQQVADSLQVSPLTVRRMISRGDLRAHKYKGSGFVRIFPSDLDRARRPVTSAADNLGGVA